jgi:subtilisin family serine protease
MRTIITALCLLLTACFSFAQPFVNGQLLVQLKQGKSIESVTRSFQTYEGSNINLSAKKFISPPMNIWLVEYNYEGVNQERFLNEVKFHPAVNEAQLNHHIYYRSTVPNDPQFNQQWQYINTGQGGGTPGADIDADLAWDITTGGLTAFGDTIVVCVIDEGFSQTHPDFGDNKWINYAEIPNNNVDDDGNGYEDDYRGWNADNNTDDISGGTGAGGHGTCVAGIVGAQGDNGVGVTGVNWNVKIMFVVGGGNEAQAVEAYTYPLVQRKRYNQSGGTEGAFVVATNASWGINGGQPADAPLWCAMYDSLGAYGVLNAGATINGNNNVDNFGDLPTACPSDWLISVTNTNDDDNKVTQAGYGLITIDLGAPGENAHTVAYPNGYAGFGGTSGATPHVAGTIGLLYSAPCTSFMALAYADPAEAALQVKQYILDGVDPNASLNGITVTGGRLNVFNALNELLNNCSAGSCVTPFSINTNSVTDTSAVFVWNSAPGTVDFDLIYRPTGSNIWTSAPGVTSPFSVTDLVACTEYEFQVLAICDTDSSNWSQSHIFTTDGCCLPPSGLILTATTDTSATFTWDDLLAAESYNVEYSIEGSSSWTVFGNITDNTYELTGLEPCKEYQFRVQTVCDTGLTDYSDILSFTTKGCGACTDLAYCETKGEDASEEWIAGVELNQIDNNSGSDGGYADYTDGSTVLGRNQIYNIILTPGFPGQAFNEVFRVWIDYNQNGSFGDAGETVYASGTTTTAVTGTFTVPSTATLGSTRLRVSMKFTSAPQSCSNPFNYGEAEDYCVEIIEHDSSNTNGIYSGEPELNLSVYPNPFTDVAVMEFTAPANETYSLNILDVQGRIVQNYSNINAGRVMIEKKNLTAGIYLFELRNSKTKIEARGKIVLK